jgi:putative tricarboxylic transport membrane protein
MNWLKKKDVLIGMFFLLISILIYSYSLQFDKMANEYAKIGTGFAPRIMSIALGLLSLSLIYTGLKSKTTIRFNTDLLKQDNLRLLLTIVLCFSYIFTLDLVGFRISTLLFLILLMLLFKVKNIIKILIVSSTVTFAIFWIFSNVLRVPLP